jgi:hypothetical protein
MTFDFFNALANVQLAEPEVKATKVKADKTPRVKAELNPTNGADIRIFANGKVYPSAAFAEEFGLEYQTKDSEVVSNGVDFFNSDNWVSYKSGPQLLLAYVVPQTEAKVELFAGTRFDDEGKPKSSVLDQGSPISPESLEVLATALGSSASDGGDTSAWHNLLISLGTEKDGVNVLAKYVDLVLVREIPNNPLIAKDGIYLIPKQVDRGPKKGQWSYERRENLKVLPLVVFTEEAAAIVEEKGSVSAEFVAEEGVEQPVEVTQEVEETQEVQG